MRRRRWLQLLASLLALLWPAAAFIKAYWRDIIALPGTLGDLVEWRDQWWPAMIEQAAALFAGHPAVWLVSAVAATILAILSWPDIKRILPLSWRKLQQRPLLDLSLEGVIIQRFNDMTTGAIKLRCGEAPLTDILVRLIEDDSSVFLLSGFERDRRMKKIARLAPGEQVVLPLFRYIPRASGNGDFIYEMDWRHRAVCLPFTKNLSIGAFSNETSSILPLRIRFDEAARVSIERSDLFDDCGFLKQRPDIIEEALELDPPESYGGGGDRSV